MKAENAAKRRAEAVKGNKALAAKEKVRVEAAAKDDARGSLQCS